jgi:Na+/melibiose symporter-like transporter
MEESNTPVQTQKRNVFTNKNFVLIFLGALVSNIGAILYNFVVSYWILDITGKNAIVSGVYLGVCGLTFVLASLIGGVLSDRFNKAKLMYICDFAKGIIIAVSSVIIILGTGSVTLDLVVLFAAGILGNIISAIFSPSSASLLPLVVEEDSLQQANSYQSVLQSMQSIIGAFLAAFLYSTLPISTTFFIVAGCYVLSGISEMFIRYNYVKKEEKLTLKAALSDINDGFSYVLSKRALFSLLSIIVLLNFFISPIMQNLLPYFIKTDVESNPNFLFHEVMKAEMWEPLISLSLAISSIIFGIVLSIKKRDEKPGKTVKIWLLVFSILLVVFTLSYIFLVKVNDSLNTFLIATLVIFFLTGMTLSFINIPINTTVQIITDKDKLGKVSSILQLVSQGLVPIATFIAGFIIDGLGSAGLLAICSTGILIVTIVGFFNKSIDTL